MAAKHGSYKPGGSYKPTRGKFAGRTFSTYEHYRTALAKKAGKKSPAAMRVANATKRAKTASLTDEDRLSAFRALSRMRNDGVSLTQAARKENIRPQDIRAHIPSGLRKRRGRFFATRTDSAPALMKVQTPAGTVEAIVVGSANRYLVVAHWYAVREVASGRFADLNSFRGVRVAIDGGGSLELLTDPAQIRDLVKRGLLDMDGPYAMAGAA